MNAQEMKSKYADLYGYMASSRDPENMKAFGKVMTEMFMWMAENKSEAAQEWLDKLESINWDNYLTQKEAEKIVSGMKPAAPWSREKWRDAMMQKGYKMEDAPCYNSCALWVTMNMLMSDSSDTLGKYVGGDKLFDAVHALAVDKLCDEDNVFSIRKYFSV
jgi:hypothetical protein